MNSKDKKQQMQATTEASFQTTGLQRNSFQHDWLNFALVFINVVAYVLVIFFNAASSIPQLGIFPRTNANISGDNEIEFTPAGWTFSTWVNYINTHTHTRVENLYIIHKFSS
jgi:hypothetical protein